MIALDGLEMKENLTTEQKIEQANRLKFLLDLTSGELSSLEFEKQGPHSIKRLNLAYPNDKLKRFEKELREVFSDLRKDWKEELDGMFK